MTSSMSGFKRRISDLNRNRTYLALKERFRRDKFAGFSFIVIVVLIFTAIFAPLLAPHSYHKIALYRKNQLPSWEFLLGTDSLGRDILSRLIYGTRLVIYVFAIATSFSAIVGVIIGLLSGFYGGVIDQITMRITDILLAFPSIIIALAVISVLGTGLENAIIAITITRIAPYARLVRGQVLKVKELTYVESAKAIGCSSIHIILRHILPNVASPVLIQAAFSAGSCLLTVASLSFLGLGAQPPAPEWGVMLFEARNYMRYAPHAMIFPGLAIFLVVQAFNTIGEALRDAIDPRLQLEAL